MAFDLEEFLSSVRIALENNMKDADSPLVLDRDFSADIAIYAGKYDKENHAFVKDPNANYVGVWPIIHRG